MNIANKLTIFRIILVPVMVIIAIIGLPGELLGISTTFWVMGIIFIVASITDKLDRIFSTFKKYGNNFWKIFRSNS